MGVIIIKNNNLLVLALSDVVIFPNGEVRFEYNNEIDTNIGKILDFVKEDLFLIVNPINDYGDINILELPKIGVLARVKYKINVPNGNVRAMIEGLARVEIDSYEEFDLGYKANYNEIVLKKEKDEDSYFKLLKKYIVKYVEKSPYLGNAILGQIDLMSSLSDLTDFSAPYLGIEKNDEKNLILTKSSVKRAKFLIEFLSAGLQLLKMEEDIDKKVDNLLMEQQKEIFLREKLSVIKDELGELSVVDEGIETFRKKASKLKCPPKIKKRIFKELARYDSLSIHSPESSIIREYLDWLINLPWGYITKDESDLSKVKESLDNSHYSLDDVKERILEYLAVKQNTNNLRSPILCLVGPPGVGKTSLAISIAKALGRKLTKISVGGINDEAEIIGHRRTYIGANPGRIIQGIRKAESSNPVFIIDEIDKMTKDIKGDPASSLLEVLDPEQNAYFSDHYIEEEYDLSKVLFIATANYIDQIPYELIDRLEIIDLSSYTEFEKLDITKRHLIPKGLEEHGLSSIQVVFSDEAILKIIRSYTKEAGVRDLERKLADIFRKIVKIMLVDKKEHFFNIDMDSVEKYLGKEKFLSNKSIINKEIGLVNGLAYTMFGGDVLPIEANLFKGSGELILTGSLGEVMQESCKIAVNYIKSNVELFDIDIDLIKENDIHIHFPEGAIPKDGPSAGITITTTLISLFKNKVIDNNIAMTGEITLRGRVLPIGGVREKVIAANRIGIKKIFLPKENEKDLEKVPKEVKNKIKFIFIENYNDIYNNLF